MAAKKSIGTDVFDGDPPLRSAGNTLGQLISTREGAREIRSEKRDGGQKKDSRRVKVTVLLRRSDVERVKKLQEGLRNNGYGEYTKAEILSFAINNLYIADFPVKKETGRT